MNSDAAMTLAEAFTQDPLIPHYHQCGRITDGMIPGYGCGHVWQHRDETKVKSGKVSIRKHLCPECGKGPWYYVLSIEELESAKCIR